MLLIEKAERMNSQATFFDDETNSTTPLVLILNVSHYLRREINPLHSAQCVRSYVMIYLPKGQARLIVGGKCDTLRSDTLCIIPPGQTIQLQLEEGASGTLLLFRHDALQKYEGLAKFRLSNARTRVEILGLINNLEGALRSALPAKDLSVASHLGLLLVFLQRHEHLQDQMDRSTVGTQLAKTAPQVGKV